MTSGRLSEKFSEPLSKMFCHSVFLIGSIVLTGELLLPLQINFVTNLSPTSSIVFLPFGIIVIVSFFEGKRAPLYLLPGTIAGCFLYCDTTLTAVKLIGIMAVNICTAPAIFCLLDWSTLCNRREDMLHPRAWRILILGGFVSSLVTSLLIHRIQHDQEFLCEHSIDIVMQHIIGYMIGMVAVLGALILLFRFSPRLCRTTRVATCNHKIRRKHSSDTDEP